MTFGRAIRVHALIASCVDYCYAYHMLKKLARFS